MPARETPFVDWKPQRTLLQPYIDGQGGLIRVEVDGDGPDKHFADALGYRLRQAGTIVVNMSADNESTRYIDDLVGQLERSFSMGLPEVAGAVAVSIANNATIGGNASFDQIAINADDSLNHVRLERLRRERCAKIIGFVRERRVRACVFLFRTHAFPPRTLSHLSSYLWDAGLRELTACGFLLVEFHRRGHPWTQPGWPLKEDRLLRLRCEYSEADRESASEDLAVLMKAWGHNVSGEVALERAKGILGVTDGPVELYSRHIPRLAVGRVEA